MALRARRYLAPALIVSTAALTAFVVLSRGRAGAAAVPEPAKPVDLDRYLGRWYEIGRYENRFERGCQGVTADYALLDGKVQVINTCRRGGLDGPVKFVRGRAKVVEGAANAKLRVAFFGSFFGPQAGNYWVLDHGDDYTWSIVGEPSGRYLWLLSRTADLSPEAREILFARAVALGYDIDMIRTTAH